MSQVQINIDAGLATLPNFINIDITGRNRGDYTVDLGRERLPFEDNSVDLLFAYHALEHIPDYISAMAEIHRVMKHGGRLLLGLPYVSLTEYNLINPYHLHNFNEYSFDFFDADRFADLSIDNPVLFKRQFYRLHYLEGFKYLPKPLKNWSRRHLLNVVQKMDIGLVAIKDSSQSINTPSEKDMLQEFQQYFDQRIPH